MNEAHCEFARERLPEYAGGRLAPAEAARVESHLHDCSECQGEAELVRLLFAGRPGAPADLARRIEGSVRAARRRAYHPWWGVAAASVAAVALGIGVASRGSPPAEEPELPGIVVGVEETSSWAADDGLIAGAPSLESLSEEALMTLLDEMGTERSGGEA